MSDEAPGYDAPPPELTVRRFHEADAEFVVLEFPTNGVRLSRAEVAILTCILRGAADADIAAGRGTAARTVSNQVSAMLAKLGVGSRAELASRWLDLISRRPQQATR